MGSPQAAFTGTRFSRGTAFPQKTSKSTVRGLVASSFLAASCFEIVSKYFLCSERSVSYPYHVISA